MQILELGLSNLLINLKEEKGGDVQDAVLKKRKLERSGYVQYAMFICVWQNKKIVLHYIIIHNSTFLLSFIF